MWVRLGLQELVEKPEKLEQIRKEFVYKSEKRLIYLNNAKVACSSIKASMFKDFDNYQDIHNYVKAHFTVNELLPEMDDYYKFTFVRNPYARLVSCYENKIVEEKGFYLNYIYGFLNDVTCFDDFIKRIIQIPGF